MRILGVNFATRIVLGLILLTVTAAAQTPHSNSMTIAVRFQYWVQIPAKVEFYKRGDMTLAHIRGGSELFRIPTRPFYSALLNAVENVTVKHDTNTETAGSGNLIRFAKDKPGSWRWFLASAYVPSNKWDQCFISFIGSVPSPPGPIIELTIDDAAKLAQFLRK